MPAAETRGERARDGQERVCGAHTLRGCGVATNMQNEPNFALADTGRLAENALRRHYERAKSCKTNPIWPGRRVNAQKQTQFRGVGWRVESPLFHHSIIPPLQSDPGRAKRSQTWGDWGMWEKEVVACGVARPGSETCETNPILGGVSRWKRQGTHEELKGAGDGRQRSVGHTQIPI
jgi:hypothetical protein